MGKIKKQVDGTKEVTFVNSNSFIAEVFRQKRKAAKSGKKDEPYRKISWEEESMMLTEIAVKAGVTAQIVKGGVTSNEILDESSAPDITDQEHPRDQEKPISGKTVTFRVTGNHS